MVRRTRTKARGCQLCLNRGVSGKQRLYLTPKECENAAGTDYQGLCFVSMPPLNGRCSIISPEVIRSNLLNPYL